MDISALAWLWLVVVSIGVVINWTVLHKALRDLHHLRILGINGQTQRDARWAMWQDGTLTGMQIVSLVVGVWHIAVPHVDATFPASDWLAIALSILMSSMGIRNLWLRRLQFDELHGRQRGEIRTREGDE